jgi:hypothetical protein
MAILDFKVCHIEFEHPVCNVEAEFKQMKFLNIW